MDSPSSSEIVEAVSPKFDGYGAASMSIEERKRIAADYEALFAIYMSTGAEEERKCKEAQLERLGAASMSIEERKRIVADYEALCVTYMSMRVEEERKRKEAQLECLGATYMSMRVEEERKCVEAELKRLGATYMSMRAEEERKRIEAELECLGATYMSMRVEEERKRKEAQLERLGVDFHARHDIRSPIRFCITGGKRLGSNEIKEIMSLGQFIPKHLAIVEEVKATIAEVCKKSTYNYQSVDGFDLTKVTLEKPPSIALVHPCTVCNLEHTDGGCYGEVKVDVREIYNALLNKGKYVEYQMYCKHDASLMGSVMFSKLKKPATGWKGKLTGVGEKVKKAKEVLPYVSTGASLVAGGLGLIMKQ